MDEKQTGKKNAARFARSLAPAILLIALAFLLYQHTVDYPFIFDDVHNITENGAIRIESLSPGLLWNAAFESPAWRRPVANITFALNYYFGGLNARWFRLTNILIHVINGTLVFLVVRSLLTLARRSRKDEDADEKGKKFAYRVALVTAVVWFVHPLQTQSVTYIVQRMTSLCVLFYLLALALFLRGRTTEGRSKWGWFVGAGVAWLLALGTKEIAATLPILLLLIELLFFHQSLRAWYQRRKTLLYAAVALFGVVGFIYGRRSFLSLWSSSYGHRDFTLLQRLMTEWRIVVHYLSQIFYPHPSRLVLDHDFVVSTSPISPPSTLLCLVVLMAMFGTGVYLARAGKRVLSLCILWYFLHLAIESTFIPLELAYEHRLYLPTIGIILGVVYGLWRYAPIPRRAGLVMIIALPLGLCVWTVQRNFVWRNAIVLWTDCVQKSPRDERAHFNLGAALADRDKHRQALTSYRRAIELEPDYAPAHFNMGNSLRRMGHLRKAVKAYKRGLELRPDAQQIHVNLGRVLADLGRTAEAIRQFREALQLRPGWPSALNNLAWLLATGPDPSIRQGEEALTLARQACNAYPKPHPVFLGTLAAAQAETGRFERAQETIRKALAIARKARMSDTLTQLKRLQAVFQKNRPFRSRPVPDRESEDPRTDPTHSSR